MASEPLTLHDLFGDAEPETIVEDVYGDGTELLIGHLDTGEIDRRIRAQHWWRPGITVDHATVDHAWVTFDVHAPHCDAPDPADPGRDCDCSWDDWILYHWREATPATKDAAPVTFVRLDQATGVAFDTGAAA
ncbi:hypothetical protein ABN034_12485 [Actinopolymorpha sp. B11F2]|uniref:hypothetical protein n=1 Tax=Actinopolymorpha sp. B11F2 TaxID=3160862 RepID=UPI0032E44D7B